MKLSKSIFVTLVATFLVVGFVFAQTPKSGKDIFTDSKCNTCHSVTSQGIASKQADKYPDLSKIGEKKIAVETLKKYLLKEEKINDKNHAVKFKGTDEDLTILVNWLNTLK